ncbi:MFS transporter [Roseomonas sp. CCTCC AB2023176]|uniref:MFS transporter n=1 Tax=Roseomonas sp. CCTCC AB2023176 TaxID=3342640 RepID=UPI0035E1128E
MSDRVVRARRAPPTIAAPRWRYATVFALYAYQGLVAGFGTVAVPNAYAATGWSTEAVGAHIATIGLPWILQPLWGPIVDRYGGFAMGRRRFWVLTAFVATLLALSVLLFLDGAPLPVVSAAFFVHSCAAGLMDTATDGMIMDDVPTERLGLTNAFTRAGFTTGMLAGSSGLAWLLPPLGLGGTTAVLMAAALLIGTVPVRVRERDGDPALSLRRDRTREAGRLPDLLRELGREVVRGGNLALFAFCIAQEAAGTLLQVPLGVHLIQVQGWSAESLSSVQGLVTFLGGTAGALLAGTWTDRVGSARALSVLIGLSAASNLLAAPLLAWSDPGVANLVGPAALTLANLTSALSYVALAPAVMAASRGPVAATRFALYMAALNLGGVTGSAAAGHVASGIGLPLTAALSGLMLAAAAAAAPSMVRRAAERAEQPGRGTGAPSSARPPPPQG